MSGRVPSDVCGARVPDEPGGYSLGYCGLPKGHEPTDAPHGHGNISWGVTGDPRVRARASAAAESAMNMTMIEAMLDAAPVPEFRLTVAEGNEEQVMVEGQVRTMMVGKHVLFHADDVLALLDAECDYDPSDSLKGVRKFLQGVYGRMLGKRVQDRG